MCCLREVVLVVIYWNGLDVHAYEKVHGINQLALLQEPFKSRKIFKQQEIIVFELPSQSSSLIRQHIIKRYVLVDDPF